MKLDLDRQARGRSELELAGSVELELGEDRPPTAELAGSLTVQHLESRVLLDGELRARGQATCDRCLNRFAFAWDVPVQLMVLRDVASDEDDGELLVILQRDGEVDLSEALRECAALAYPQRTVCREDCRGLCPQCGADLNAGDCGCVAEETDPRWDGLA